MAKKPIRFLAASILTLLASPAVSKAQKINALAPVLPTAPSWDISANWSLGRIPGATDAILINLSSFAAGPSFTLDSDFTSQTLSFDTGESAVGLDASSIGAPQTLTLTGVTGGSGNALGGADLIATSSTTTGVITLGGTPGDGTLTVALGVEGTINIANPGADVVFGPDSYITGAFDLTKTGAGTLTLSSANSYTGNTIVNAGTLLLDFTASGSPADNIIPDASALTLGGATLAVRGAGSASNSQGFSGLTLNPGASTITVTSGTGGAANLSVGAITRALGSTVDFSLPANGVITTTSGTAGGAILTVSGVPFATVNGNDWAATDSTNTHIVGGSTVANFYTPSTAVSLSGNADAAPGVATTTLPTGVATTITSLRFNQAQPTTIAANGGSTLVTGGVLVTPAVGKNAVLIASDLTGTLEGANGELVVIQNNPSSSLEIDAAIADNGVATTLTKSGPGALILTGANTYSGGTIINGGTLNINADSALGAASGSAPNITFNGGGLQLAATAGTVNLNGNRNIAIANGATATIDTNGAGNTLVFPGVISGNGSLTKIGAGTLDLIDTVDPASTFAYTYTGATTVNGGVIVLDFSQANTFFNIIANTSNLIMGGGAVQVIPYFAQDTILHLNGAQVFSGTTLNPGASGLYTQGSAATYFSSLFLGPISREVGSTVDFADLANSTFTTTGTANTLLTSNGAAYATVGGSDWAATVSTNNNVTSTNSEIPGFYIVGGSTIPGFYTASTSASLSGNADVGSGITSTALPTGATAISSLRFNQTQGTAINIGAGNTLVTGGILVTSAVGANLSQISGGTLEGAAGQDLVIIQNNPSAAMEIDSVIAGNATATGLTKSGPGELVLTGPNTYTGGTIVNGGTLNINADAALGGAPATPITNLSFTASSTLQLAASAGAVTLNDNRNISITNQSTVTLDTNGLGNSLAIGGVISGGNASLNKVGAGSLILSGANTFTGPTTVNGGELHASAAGTLAATSMIMVNDTATLELDATNALGSAAVPAAPPLGAGSLLGVTDVTLNNGGLLAAGASAGDGATIGLGMLTLTGADTNLTFLSTTITLNLNAFVSNGNELTIMSWNGGPGGIVADGTADRFIVNQDLGALGTLSNIQFNLSGVLTPAAEIPLGNGEFQIVPEPASWMTGLLGAASLGLYRRRRARTA